MMDDDRFMGWRVNKCDVHDNILAREFIAMAELRLTYRDSEDPGALHAMLSEGPLTIIPSNVIDELYKKLRMRNDRIRALEDELDKVKNAIAVLRGLGDGC